MKNENVFLNYLLFILILLTGCKSINKYSDEKYKLLNDILLTHVNKTSKSYFVCYCQQEINYSEVIKSFYAKNEDVIFRRQLLIKSVNTENKNNINWIFNNDDISFFARTYKNETYYNCWDKDKIFHKVELVSCEEINNLFSDENIRKHIKGKPLSIPKNSHQIYISLPFFNENKTKAFFAFNDTEISKETAPKIAIAEKEKNKWRIIGVITEGYD